MPRAIILLLDSFGVGNTSDAHKYNDQGANTFRHIAEYCLSATHSQSRKVTGPLHTPNLTRLGLNEVGLMCTDGTTTSTQNNFAAKYGYAEELSYGKDTPSGHWEIAGVPVLFDWGYFPPEYPSFPEELTEKLIKQAGLPGILGNKHASGTDIITELGSTHLETGSPIVYTSADSVFQIAAHEGAFGLDRLYRLCETARELVNEYNIGRVIARPFLGNPGNFYRTGNRRDYSTSPPQATLLDKLVAKGGTVIAIGKTADIFAHQGISKEIKAIGNMEIFDKTLQALKDAPDNSLIFSNFVDFDSVYGHRRNTDGYAAALEEWDTRLPELEPLLKSDDIVIITADHGCDPTWPGSDHTRECIPILAFGQHVLPGNIGKRETFADIGQSLAQFFNLEKFPYGTSFL